MSIGLKGNADGSGAVQVGGSDAITISTGLVVTGSAGNLMLQSGTAVASTSGTSIDFTGIPSWAKRVTVMFSGVSTSGTSNVLIQLGDSGGVKITGYIGSSSNISSAVSSVTSTDGFILNASAGASLRSGILTINLLNGATFTYAAAGTFGEAAATTYITGGYKSLPNILDRVRITTVSGTVTFTAGTINILWE